MNLPDALVIATNLRDELLPVCARCEIAGGVRRGKEDPHDIELVVIPADRRPPVEFGQKHPVFPNELELLLWRADKDNLLRKQMGGPKYKKFRVDPSKWGVQNAIEFVNLDLFIVTPETWGAQMVIRTGPAEFSHWLVTPFAMGGCMPDGMFEKDGRLWPGPKDTPEEIDYLAALGLPWIEPKDRRANWRRA